jgi:TldD protein
MAAINAAARNLRLTTVGNGALVLPPAANGRAALYPSGSPVGQVSLPERIALLQAIDAYLRTKDARVCQVSAVLAAGLQEVFILRPDGYSVSDERPMIRLVIRVVVQQNGRRESANEILSGRWDDLTAAAMQKPTWMAMADKALATAVEYLGAIPCPAGDMPVILGNGFSGVLLHEAIGHGFEGDSLRQGSCFSGMMGQRVASKGVTIVDDGTVPLSRGSLNVDDEGTPTRCTTLVEDGIFVGAMQDRLNGALAGTGSTGNGRRESYAHRPLVRMTNTYMLAGTEDRDDIIASTKGKAIMAVSFSGGQVNTAAGTFVFNPTVAYLIENGKVIAPVKGATLLGDARKALLGIDAVGNDMTLASGGGNCGKDGQTVPVSLGQPTLRIAKGITVGGADAS